MYISFIIIEEWFETKQLNLFVLLTLTQERFGIPDMKVFMGDALKNFCFSFWNMYTLASTLTQYRLHTNYFRGGIRAKKQNKWILYDPWNTHHWTLPKFWRASPVIALRWVRPQAGVESLMMLGMYHKVTAFPKEYLEARILDRFTSLGAHLANFSFFTSYE